MDAQIILEPNGNCINAPFKQESIPVGCVPSAAVAVSGEGVVCLGGVFPTGCQPRRVCLPGGCLPGGCLPKGVYTHPVNRTTDRLKYITFPQLPSLKSV